MDKVDLFLKAEKERMEHIPVPPRYERVLADSLAAAGLTEDDIVKVSADLARPASQAQGASARSDAAGGVTADKKAKRRARRRIWIPAVAACVALLIAVGSFLPSRIPTAQEPEVPQALPESFRGVITVGALYGADDRMDPLDGFRISSTEAMPPGLVERALILDPEFDFELHPKDGGREYELIPLAPLEENSVYRIAFDPEHDLSGLSARGSFTWAFQTAGAFCLNDTLPVTHTAMMPVNVPIELRFSAAPDVDSVADKVTISPALPGQWSVRGNTAVYLPKQAPAYATLYEISIEEGIRESGGPGVTESGKTVLFFTEDAPGSPGDAAFFSLQGQNLAFPGDEAPVIGFYLHDWPDTGLPAGMRPEAEPSDTEQPEDVSDEAMYTPYAEAAITLYAFQDSLAYGAALAEKQKNSDWLYGQDVRIATDDLAYVADHLLRGYRQGDTGQVSFPDVLPKGYYLAEITVQERTRQMLLQVTDLSAYLTVGEEEALLWVHDPTTGLPAAGAEIYINDKLVAYTDDTGLAYIESIATEDKTRCFDIRSGADRVLLADVSETYEQAERIRDRERRRTVQAYWSYLSVDKPIYRPGDTLYFFGLIAPRGQNAAEVRDVSLRLESGGGGIAISQDCAVIGDVFQGSMVIPVLLPGYFRIGMYMGDSLICASSVEIGIDEKQPYRFSFLPDKKEAIPGETIQWTAALTYFDGAPLGEQPITFRGSGIDGEKVVATDANGEVRFSTRAAGSADGTGTPGSAGGAGNPGNQAADDYVYASTILPEMGEIGREGRVSLIYPESEKGGVAADDRCRILQEDGGLYCRTGDTVAFILRGDDITTEVEGQYLFFRAGETIRDFRVTTENRYAFFFDETELPGSHVMGVFFDGHRYFPAVSPACASVDPQDRALSLSVQTDKDRYFPGETVVMELRLTDRLGKPVRGMINLTMAEEAMLSPGEREIGTGEQLFLSNPYDFAYRTAASHPLPAVGAATGEDGKGSEREDGREDEDGKDGMEDGKETTRPDFRETVLFRMLYTDPDGRIRITFSLPERSGDWRLTWQAYAQDIRAGSGATTITTHRPFYTEMRFNGPVLEGDEPIPGLRAAGEVIDRASPAEVSWTLLIPEIGYGQATGGPAYAWKDVSLPALKPGTYTLQAHGVWDQYSDSVTRFFDVEDSRPYHDVSETAAVEDGFIPAGSDSGPTTVVFSDLGGNEVMAGLTELAGQESLRLDQRIASWEAGILLREYFGLDRWPSVAADERLRNEQMLRYQNGDGGITNMLYGASDLYTGVWAASAGGAYFSREDLAMYFMRILEDFSDSSVDKTMALWGAAACGRPVLAEIRDALRENSYQSQTLTDRQRLNLLCAMLFIGDGYEALPYAEEMLAGRTEDTDGILRARIGGDRTETLAATAQMAVVAAILDLPQSRGLYRYVEENRTEDDYLLLEKLLWLRCACGSKSEAAGFSYLLDGDEIDVDLGKTAGYAITLTPEQRQSLGISRVYGAVIAESLYRREGATDATDSADTMLQIERRYEVSGLESRSLPLYGRIRAVIDYRIDGQAPDGCYNIFDCLPAGLRYVSMETADGATAGRYDARLLKEEGHRLTFGVYKEGEAVEGQIRFNVRVVMPGAYLAPPASLAHSRIPDLCVRTEESKLYIN